jgi:hypothetical protein
LQKEQLYTKLTTLPKYSGVKTIDKSLVAKEVPEPTIIAIAGCKQDTVRINLGDDYQKEINKNDFGVFVVIWDFLVIIILVWFVNFLDKR